MSTNKSYTVEEVIQLEEAAKTNTEIYFKLYNNECCSLSPELCEYFVTPNLTALYNIIDRLLTEEEMLGICYWTKLIDGGSAWIVHPIKCSDAKMFKDEQTGTYKMTAHSLVYDKVYEFNLKTIQYISHGPKFITRTDKTLAEITTFRQYDVYKQLSENQDKELCFSERFLKENVSMNIRLLLCEIFKCVLLWEDFVVDVLDEKLSHTFRDCWLDVILNSRDKAKQTIQQELEELENDENYNDTIEEINLIIDMLDNIDAEYRDVLDGCNNINDILNTWPPILLPHPYPDVLDYVANHFRKEV